MSENIRDIIKAIEVAQSGGVGIAPGSIRDSIMRESQKKIDNTPRMNPEFDLMQEIDPDLDIMVENLKLAKRQVYQAISDGMPPEEIVKTFGAEMIKSIFLPHVQSLKQMNKARKQVIMDKELDSINKKSSGEVRRLHGKKNR